MVSEFRHDAASRVVVGTVASAAEFDAADHHAGGFGFAVTVAASNSRLRSLATPLSQVHYTCDGVADDVQIQAAIDLVNAAGGGKVLCDGRFVCASPII